MNEEKNLIIVYNKETEKYANFLRSLLTQDDDTEEKIIGVKDGTVDVVVHSYEEYKQNKISIGRDNYILFIGNDKNIKKETEFIKIEGKYSMKYGWIGKNGVLFVDKNSKLEKEEYEEFLQKLSKYGSYIKENKKNLQSNDIFNKILNININLATSWVSAITLGPFGILGKIGWEVYKNNNKNNEVIKQQYICLILTFYFELINQFIGE